jgi:UDP-N-acetylmuramate dehydrogenase
MHWWKQLKGSVSRNEPLKRHTTFKIGGRADYFIRPHDLSDLKLLLRLAKSYKIKTFPIGSGSNILVSDAGVRGVVFSLSSASFSGIKLERGRILAGAGCSLAKLLSFVRARGLSGLEWLAGIPGTVGGALLMNAGQARDGSSIGELTESVTVIDRAGRVRELAGGSLHFVYRGSNLGRYIILGCSLKLKKSSPAGVGSRIKEYMRYRRQVQDLFNPSAGCVFKNPRDASCGKMIDLCGLKGRKIGGAQVSLRHANFIINSGNASAAEVLKLMRLIQQRVWGKFKVRIEPEIKIWP